MSEFLIYREIRREIQIAYLGVRGVDVEVLAVGLLLRADERACDVAMFTGFIVLQIRD